MRKILMFCSALFLFSTSFGFAIQEYAASPTDPGVVCSNCHTDGRTWVAPVITPTTTSDIKANGQGGTITVAAGTPVSITISLDPGNQNGTVADWWCVANTPFGWFSYLVNPIGWASGFAMTAQGAVVSLSSYEALNMQLSAGDYTFYFGVDLEPNGTIDLSSLLYDSVTVHVVR